MMWWSYMWPCTTLSTICSSLGFQDSCMWGRRKGSFCIVTSALAFESLLAEAGHVTLYDNLIGYQLALCELGVSQSLGLLNFQPPTQSLSKNMEEVLSNYFPPLAYVLTPQIQVLKTTRYFEFFYTKLFWSSSMLYRRSFLKTAKWDQKYIWL